MADVDAFCPQPITVSAILSYCGSSLDLVINYSLLVINLLGLGALQRRLQSISTMNGNSSSSACTHRPPSLGSTLLSLGFVIAFQIILCLFVGCVGISIIWCAIMGWMVLEFVATFNDDDTAPVVTNGSEPDRQGPRETLGSSPTIAGTTFEPRCHHRICCTSYSMAASIMLLDLFAIIYYAVTAPPITTVAHLLAILMGVILEVAARKWGRVDSSSAESSATPLLTSDG